MRLLDSLFRSRTLSNKCILIISFHSLFLHTFWVSVQWRTCLWELAPLSFLCVAVAHRTFTIAKTCIIPCCRFCHCLHNLRRCWVSKCDSAKPRPFDSPRPSDALRCSYEQVMNHECSGRNGLLRFWCFDEQNLAANAWNLSSIQLRRQTSWFSLGVWRQPWHGYGSSEQNRCSPWGASYGVLRREKTLRQHRKLLWRAGSTRGNQNLSCTGSLGLCQDHLVVSEVILGYSY